MRIPIDRLSEQPVYLQIRNHLHHSIESGALKPGDRLPSIRSLAQSIRVNKLTVIEAYSVLEGDGLIQARQGAGYYVKTPSLAVSPTPSTFDPQQEVIIPQGRSSPFAELYLASLEAQNRADKIDFSSGFPSVCDLEDLQRIARRAMKQVGETLFGYDYPQGQIRLRQQIVQLLIQQGLPVSPDNLIVTNGSKQALSLVMHHYLRPGDWVVTESPGYFGALAILENLGAKIIGIPMTGEGMNLALLQRYLEEYRPKLIYTVSTLHNPTGLTTSVAHRQQLLTLADRYQCPILEDNAYEGLNFEAVPAPIKALDRRDLVIYTSTFSKTLMPGLRVGYMVVTGKDYSALVERKLLQDLHNSTVSQAIVSEYLASGHYRRHLNKLRSHNLESRNVMVAAMERYFPGDVSWTIPKGGIFLWAHIPSYLSLAEVVRSAGDRGVLLAPGTPFFPGQGGYNALRLNFSHAPEIIEQGIAIVGDILHSRASRAS